MVFISLIVQSPEILNPQIEMLHEFKCDKYRNYWVLINTSWICLGFALDLLDTDLPDAD